jgi:aerobic carbon-monoxide dehydrogenase large subunit
MGDGGAVAIASALRDALSAIGAEVNETPITPRRVLATIRLEKEAARELGNFDCV